MVKLRTHFHILLFSQECIGEVFVTSLEPLLLDVLNIVAYRTKIMPSTDEEVAIEELPCSCRINRFSTPS